MLCYAMLCYALCKVVPTTGPFTASYTGEIRSFFSADYSTKLTKRLLSPGGATDYFLKLSAIEVSCVSDYKTVSATQAVTTTARGIYAS